MNYMPMTNTQSSMQNPMQGSMTSSQMPMGAVSAPYSPTTNLPTYAHGGSPHESMPMRTSPHRNRVMAHFEDPELHVMDELQGGARFDRGTGLKDYSHLGKLMSKMLEQPHTKDVMVQAIHEHKASGGRLGAHNLSHMAHEGRHGDTKLAYIPQDLMHLFDELSGHRSRNPHTGYPEYFNLGGFFSRLAPTLGRGLSSLGSTIGRGFGAIGRGASSVARAAAPTLRNAATSVMGAAPEGGWGKAIAGAAVPAMANMAAAKLGGADWGDAAKMGALAGSQGFNTPGAEALRGGLTASLQGANTRDSMLSALSSGAGAHDSNLGRGLSAAANMGLNGGNTQDMALAGIGGGTAGSSNPLMRGLGTAAHAKLGGYSTQDALLHGGLSAAGIPAPQPHQMAPAQPMPEEMPHEALAHGGGAYYY